MKILIRATLLSTLFILASCGSSERVITDNGDVYEVKGNTIKNNGVKVTDDLSAAEKESITKVLENNRKAKKAYDSQHKELEAAIEKQEDIQSKSEKKQKELEDQLEVLEDNLEKKQDEADNYSTAKERYNDKKEKFKKLKKEGKLSPNDIADWKEKLSDLKAEVNQAKNNLK